MKHNYFLLNKNRTSLGQKSVWTVPLHEKQFKPNMRVRLVGGSAQLATVNEYKTVSVKLMNRSHNSTSSDNTSNSVLGFFQQYDFLQMIVIHLTYYRF